MLVHRRRRGVTLIELLVVVFIIGVLLAILLPAVQSAREAGRRVACISNLKQLGIALHAYHDSMKSFPAGFCAGSARDLPRSSEMDTGNTHFYANGIVLLLPHFEQRSLADRYDHEKPWYEQSPEIFSATIPTLICPSASHQNPWTVDALVGKYPGGNTFGLTDYVLSKGVCDGWCMMPSKTPADARGMFDGSGPRNLGSIFDFLGINPIFVTRLAHISDGASNTFAMGEGSGGSRWSLDSGTQANNIWLGSPFTTGGLWAMGIANERFSSVFGSTIVPMNTKPVRDTIISSDPGDFLSCNSSIDWRDDGRPTGKATTSNFRSDHSGGAAFLMADGSVHFLDEAIDMAIYRGLSTIAGGDASDLPD